MNETSQVQKTQTQKRLPSASKAARKAARKSSRKKKTWGWPVTILLFLVLAALVSSLWALFISGPVRIHDEQIARVTARIDQEVPGVQGLTEHAFDYVTWQGYTDDTLYWFDSTGGIITQRDMSTLDYSGARKTALDQYGMEAETVLLAYGYSGPVYQLENDDMLLMLDYDSLDWVYERNLNHA